MEAALGDRETLHPLKKKRSDVGKVEMVLRLMYRKETDKTDCPLNFSNSTSERPKKKKKITNTRYIRHGFHYLTKTK